MKYLVTLSDINYIDKGLVLYDSIQDNTKEDFVLYYLCLDDESFDIINKINNENIIAYKINKINKEEDFMTLAKNNSSNPNDYSDYHFALASYITYHLMNKFNLPEIIYVDSDIVFYNDIKILFDVVKNKSIGLILHRHNKFGCHVGCYNVGIIYFRNDEVGITCLKWWRDVVMDKNNPWAKQYGTCGDQKYLEAFGKLFGNENIKIYDDDIGHGAPWNFKLYKYLDDDVIMWNNKKQDLIFNHFSHFDTDDVNDTYKIDRKGEWGGCLGKSVSGKIKHYYDDYFDKIKKVKTKYSL